MQEQMPQRQAELDALIVGRDKELGDYVTPVIQEYAKPSGQNIQIAKGIGKIKRVKPNGGQQRNRRAPHVRQ